MAEPLTIPPATESVVDSAGKLNASWYRLLQKLVQDHNRVSVEAAAVVNAADVVYDDATSGLTADDVQEAIDEVEGRVDTLEAVPTVVEVIAAGAISGGATEVVIALGTYDMVEIDLNNLEPSNDAVALNARYSQDGGSSYLSDASDYSWLVSRLSSTAVGGATDTADSEITIIDTTGNAAGAQNSLKLRIYRPSASSWSKTMIWNGHAAPSGARHNLIGNGVLLANTDDITHVRFFWSAGTFDAGHYAARGYRFS
jgi:hypothetical protein